MNSVDRSKKYIYEWKKITAKMKTGETLEVMHSDFHRFVEGYFPGRASASPFSDKTTSFITAHSWHYDEKKEMLERILK